MSASKKLSSKIKLLAIAVSVCFTVGCFNSSDEVEDLLAVAVKSSIVASLDSYNLRLNEIDDEIKNNENVFFVLSRMWSFPKSMAGVMSAIKLNGSGVDTYHAVVIFNGVPYGDSVSGSRYDIKMHYSDNGMWSISEIRESWRCWEGRGHRYFSDEPCV